MATNITKKRDPTVFLNLSGKDREVILEMDLDKLNTDEGMKLLYEIWTLYSRWILINRFSWHIEI